MISFFEEYRHVTPWPAADCEVPVGAAMPVDWMNVPAEPN
jgi:hypothetical protein